MLKVAQVLFGTAVMVFLVWYFWLGGLESKVANDAEKDYQMAVKYGTPADRCVKAGLVAESALLAHDEAKYATWKMMEKTMCDIAGIPR